MEETVKVSSEAFHCVLESTVDIMLFDGNKAA